MKVFSWLLLGVVTVACTKEKIEDKHEAMKPVILEDHSESSSKTKTVYTCAMHPHVHESEPGKCPLCNMNLTKLELNLEEDAHKSTHPGHQVSAHEAIAKVKLKKSQLNHFRPSFFPVTEMKMSKKVHLLGVVLQSEDKESTIPARVGGRVEKVFVKSTGSFVKKGDPVVLIYSPKLITTGQEYLLSRKSYEQTKQAEFKELQDQARERLELWGFALSNTRLGIKNLRFLSKLKYFLCPLESYEATMQRSVSTLKKGTTFSSCRISQRFGLKWMSMSMMQVWSRLDRR